MLEMRNGSFYLFKAFGIRVYLHWLWFVVAYLFIQYMNNFENSMWALAAFVSLFGIVLLHEFGHALACKSVGGRASMIMLWPLGGIAFVNPPPRPGAVLWSIAAGPLVNLVLVPITFVLVLLVAGITNPMQGHLNDFQEYVFWIAGINLLLLLFNMLPIFPLDGGQILQAILWFFIGRARSLRVASVIGLICAVPLGLLFVLSGDLFGVAIALFIGWQAWNGYRAAQYLAEHEDAMNPWDREKEA